MKESIQSLGEILENWEESAFDHLPRAFLALVILMLFFFLARFAKMLSLKIYSKSIKVHADTANIIASLVYFFLGLSGVVLALKIIGLEQILAHLLAGAGIIGIIAGFAFQDIASNIFAGLLLKIQHPFKKGDWVNLDSCYGMVEQVGWITTTVRTIQGQEVFVPNQVTYRSPFTNFSTYQKRRVVLEAKVPYGDNLEKVRNIAIDEVKKIGDPLLQEEDIDFFYTGIGSSAYNFQLRFWIKFDHNDDYLKTTSDIIMQIKTRFEEENIPIV